MAWSLVSRNPFAAWDNYTTATRRRPSVFAWNSCGIGSACSGHQRTTESETVTRASNMHWRDMSFGDLCRRPMCYFSPCWTSHCWIWKSQTFKIIPQNAKVISKLGNPQHKRDMAPSKRISGSAPDSTAGKEVLRKYYRVFNAELWLKFQRLETLNRDSGTQGIFGSSKRRFLWKNNQKLFTFSLK